MMSDDAKRYMICGGGAHEAPGGTWVRADDYERLRAEVERLKAREITDEQIDAAWAIAVAGGVRLWDHSAAHAISALGIVGCPGCWSCMEHDSKEARLRKDCHGHGWIREEHGDE